MGLHLSQGVDPRLDLWMGQTLGLLMDPVLAQLGLGLGVALMVDLWMSLDMDHQLGLEADLLMDLVLAQLGLGLGVALMVGLEQGQTLELRLDPLLDQMVDLWMSLDMDHHLGLEADLLLDPEIVDLSLEMSAMDWKV